MNVEACKHCWRVHITFSEVETWYSSGQTRLNFYIGKGDSNYMYISCFMYFIVQKGCVELRDWSTADEVHFLAKRKKKGKKQQDMQRWVLKTVLRRSNLTFWWIGFLFLLTQWLWLQKGYQRKNGYFVDFGKLNCAGFTRSILVDVPDLKDRACLRIPWMNSKAEPKLTRYCKWPPPPPWG